MVTDKDNRPFRRFYFPNPDVLSLIGADTIAIRHSMLEMVVQQNQGMQIMRTYPSIQVGRLVPVQPDYYLFTVEVAT